LLEDVFLLAAPQGTLTVNEYESHMQTLKTLQLALQEYLGGAQAAQAAPAQVCFETFLLSLIMDFTR
jgi:hypothetical protein